MWEILLGILVFGVAAALDFAYTKWIDYLKKRRRWSAASWALICGFIGWILGETVYNHSSWYVIPELVGFFVGTAIAVKPDGKSDH